ncbi:MAG: quinol dehydrogenase ferredoxin subunit NapH [Desulfobulbaceae bacterium]|jgi:ferredoxin-type protein NapH|nr:quinol dehydrogenase ferredoxin subunit NapH [Desulfobulbaceae bacterium]
MTARIPGREAIRKKGMVRAAKWLALRRISQLAILLLFLLGPLAGVWIVRGSFSASMTLDVLPLTDPLTALQSLLAGHTLGATALIGALIVAVFYLLVGGRAYCSWACPVNLVTDAAAWLGRRLDLKKSIGFNNTVRYWLLGFILLLAPLTGAVVWEWVNPVTILQRGLLFGIGLGWAVVAAIFLFDLLVVRRGWCGHLCPVGALYSLPGFLSLLRVRAARREQCTDCMDCYSVCPEPQVIRPALKGEASGSPVILSGNCTNCGRCIDICPENVFQFSQRF